MRIAELVLPVQAEQPSFRAGVEPGFTAAAINLTTIGNQTRRFYMFGFNRASVRINPTAWGVAEVEVLGSLDGQNWDTLKTKKVTLNGSDRQALDFDIQSYLWLIGEVTKADVTADAAARIFVYAYAPPFDPDATASKNLNPTATAGGQEYLLMGDSDARESLAGILAELRILNLHVSMATDNEITVDDVSE